MVNSGYGPTYSRIVLERRGVGFLLSTETLEPFSVRTRADVEAYREGWGYPPLVEVEGVSCLKAVATSSRASGTCSDATPTCWSEARR